jgi:hypothetical protein
MRGQVAFKSYSKSKACGQWVATRAQSRVLGAFKVAAALEMRWAEVWEASEEAAYIGHTKVERSRNVMRGRAGGWRAACIMKASSRLRILQQSACVNARKGKGT